MEGSESEIVSEREREYGRGRGRERVREDVVSWGDEVKEREREIDR